MRSAGRINEFCLDPTVAELGAAIRRLGRIFRAAGLNTAALDARLLASHICALSPEAAIANQRFKLSPAMIERINDAALRRLNGEPVSRIMGRREFWGLCFELSPHTLDPRPETELLVEAVLDYARRESLLDAPLRILDLGAGSGCVIASLLSELPHASGVGVDLSEDALGVARENLRRLGLLNRASFLCADWTEALGRDCFDVIVSNPPYLSFAEMAGLEPEVKAFDPYLALYGGEDGLEAYRVLLPEAVRLLRREGFLIFETGWMQAQAVRNMMELALSGAGYFEARILTDLAGKERAVAGRRQSFESVANSKKKVGNPVLSG